MIKQLFFNHKLLIQDHIC